MNGKMVVGSVVALMWSAGAQAATLIEFTDSEGETGKVWIDGNKMRSDAEGGYVIMDWDAGKAYLVNLQAGIAMDMSHILHAKAGAGGGDSAVDAVVEKVGDGPTIAGYDTVQYRISVEGEHCQDVYASAKALRDLGAADIFDRLRSMGEDDEDMDYGWGDPCDRADESLDFLELGLPLRTENVRSGEVDEISRIERDAALPDGGFTVPDGLQLMDMSQMMQRGN